MDGFPQSDMGNAPASELARRLFGGPAPWRVSPFWADGGDGRREPAGHVLAALPSAVHRARVEAFEPRELLTWLRSRLREADGELCVVLLAYDAGRNLEALPATAQEDPELPDVVVARYPAWIESAGPEGPWRVCGAPSPRRALEALLRTEPAPVEEAAWPSALDSRMSRRAYDAALADVLAGIAAGDLYEANVARRLEAPLDPRCVWPLYRALRDGNPAAFGALWALDEALWLASSSPECLLTWDRRSRRAHSYPIKGTRARGRTSAEDDTLAAELASSAKDRAEHVMIVDLVRNDLGRVAVPGSVRVDDLFSVHRLPTVHHMISDVSAEVRQGLDLVDVLGALFPGGSITGAPKIAAMERIERVEGLRRGFYTGSLGVVRPDGSATFNILIRTAVAANGRLLYQTGGAIVADSDPDEEWRETELKAEALSRTLRGAAREAPPGPPRASS